MQLRWEIPFDDLKTIIMDTGGIGLVMQDDVNGPFIPLPEKAQKGFLFGALSKCVEMRVWFCLAADWLCLQRDQGS